MAEEKSVLLEGVRIIFRNFAGEERMFNAEGDRNFTVVLPEDIGEQMLKDGWNVKRLRPREEGEEGDLSLKVKVSFKGRSKPRMHIYAKSKGVRTLLDEESAEVMDWPEFDNVELIIRPYDWLVNGKNGRTAYLQSIVGTIHEDPLELKYAHIPEIGPDGQYALPPGDDPNVIDVDGEWVEEEHQRAIER
jgi:hypothetical protein